MKLQGQKAAKVAPKVLLEKFRQIRKTTETLAGHILPEDAVIQSMPDVSPTKWHLAHTTWFFEQFLLKKVSADFKPFNGQFEVLFNSYYNAIGNPYPRAQRGLLSRPTLDEILKYRHAVQEQVEQLLSGPEGEARRVSFVVELGIQHEQQHQELILTDIKHVLSKNPLKPVYQNKDLPASVGLSKMNWLPVSEGMYLIGQDKDVFSFDNEMPAHRVFLNPFLIASRPVTNAEFLAFICDNGYERPDLWLSDGWRRKQEEKWQAPLYWTCQDGDWWTFTLQGYRPLLDSEPVCHISYYEADAFARWAEARLLTEFEWEAVAKQSPLAGHFLEMDYFHPFGMENRNEEIQASQLFGSVWEWTLSAYLPYPGFRPLQGALGEYNGKFMCNQMVLRGGSCATPESHIRPSYRNFFYPADRWQFSGLRLAREVK